MTLLLCHDGIGAVSADVVESIDLALLVLDKEELEARDLSSQPVTSLDETEAVCSEKPLLGKNGSTFKVVHLLRDVP